MHCRRFIHFIDGICGVVCMKYEISLSDKVNFAPSTVVEEVMQNCRTILGTILGSVPLERGIGTTWEYVGKPIPVAMNLLRTAIYDAFANQEPRAIIDSIKFDAEENPEVFAEQGVLIPHVIIYISE